MPPLPHRLARFLLIALVAILAPIHLAAAGPLAPDTQAPAITLSAEAAYGGVYRPRSWLPILVSLENSGPDRQVEVQIGARNGTQYAVDLDLPNGGRKLALVYVYIATSVQRLQVRLLNDGAELRSDEVRLLPAPSLARIVGVVAGPGVAPRLPARLPSGPSVVTVPLSLSELPERAEGLSSFDALILDDVAGADLGPAQREALREWVLRGGQVIVSGGSNAERSLAALPESLRPAAIGGTASVPAATLFGPDTGAAELPIATFLPLPDADGRAPYALPISGLGADQPLAIEQSYGRGAVSLIALPLAHPAVLSWAELPRFWDDLIHAPNTLPSGFAPDGMSLDTFVDGNLAGTLTGLPALAFPPLLTLGILLALYIVLVGPGTYLVLRRLDRQSLGWVVVPLLTLGFAGVTYGLGHAQRGGDVLVNQVTLVEPLGGDGQAARIRSFAGIFSPANTDYRLSLNTSPDAPQPLLRPISVQGPWDTGSAAMGGVFVQEAPAGAQVRGFTVAQWSMRAVAADSISSYAGLSATITVAGESLRGEVINRSGRPIEDVALIQGDRVLRLGTLEPGERKTGDLQRRANAAQQGGMPLSYMLYGEQIDMNSKSGGQPLPPELQLRVRLLDAIFAYGPIPQSSQPLLIAWSRDPSLQVQPDDLRAELQHMALITAAPRIVAAEGTVALERGWLMPRISGGPQTSFCFGSIGAGVTMGVDPVIMQFQLPRDLYGIRPSELTLVTGTDGPWLPEQVVEIYDWRSGAWVAQPAAGGELVVDRADAYLSSHGQVRVRLSTTLEQPSFNCVYVDIQLKGMMP